MPKVSAVIPTTLDERRLPFIRAALDSVLAQRFRDYEVLVVHNGSDPDRKRLLDDHLPHIRYCYTAIGNVGGARNTGVREARGEYVAFLDDDDLWLPDKLAVQVAALEANPDLDVLFSDSELFDDTGVVYASYIHHVGHLDRLHRKERSDALYVQDGSWFEYLIRNCPFLPSCWIGKRDVLLAVPFVRTLSEDRELLWRLSREHTLGFVTQVLTRKRNHASNISSDIDECVQGMLEGARHAAGWSVSPREREILRGLTSDAHFELGYTSRRRGEHLKALRHQAASFMAANRVRALKEVLKNVVLWRGREADPAVAGQ
jgi:glycosyltransferase involved in cell wall biosynthesis